LGWAATRSKARRAAALGGRGRAGGRAMVASLTTPAASRLPAAASTAYARPVVQRCLVW
jgi:hypothetical protein